MALVVVEKVETRDDLATALLQFNARAKAESRRGYIGSRSERYADLHETLDELLDAWQEAGE